MSGRVYNVLFLCTGNSARSILAEALLNHWGHGRFRAFSAGSVPKGAVHPTAIEVLQGMGLSTQDLRSKSWDEFAAPGGPALDFIFTVCDSAAGEVCPIWPGKPMTAHWGMADPAAVEDRVARGRAFRAAFTELKARVRLLTSLPIESLSEVALKQQLQAIGTAQPSV